MILLRSMYLFGTLRSTLALIIFGSSSSAGVSANLGLGCTTKGEHHVMGSVFGTFSKMSSFTPCSSHC